ncbi:MAG TPA: HEAT repeat domain-containing protein [Nitrospiraceae bacterium]|jgi:hypothetical protein|nr:HEAT repeat domain-containing protein [Nitrospiraceae bacterium]
MMMLRRLAAGIVLLTIFAMIPPSPALADERVLTDTELQLLQQAKSIYVDASTSTWRSRGRVSFSLVPSLRMKLQAAGFAVVTDPAAPHDLTLNVIYREERGKQFRIDLYGIEILCRIRLAHAVLGPLFNLTIHESSTYQDLDTGPYVEALHRLESDPYYYFLGDLVKGTVSGRLDLTGSLIQGLQRLASSELSASASPEAPPNPADTLPDAAILHARPARDNTILELARLKDARALPVLTQLLSHRDPRVRLASVRALGEIRSSQARPAIERVASQDGDHEVREAATAVLASLSTSALP